VIHLELDNLRYLSDQGYRRLIHASLRRAITTEPLALRAMDVVHKAGNSCCGREAWPLTHARLLAALAADGDHVIGVMER